MFADPERLVGKGRQAKKAKTGKIIEYAYFVDLGEIP